MSNSYRVVDLRSAAIDPADIIVNGAKTPEAAAEAALGVKLVRSGAKKDLVARVYWQPPGQPITMVRLYKLTSEVPA
jgi:hypothetical protein